MNFHPRMIKLYTNGFIQKDQLEEFELLHEESCTFQKFATLD